MFYPSSGLSTKHTVAERGSKFEEIVEIIRRSRMASFANEVVNENHPGALCDLEEMEVQFKKDKTPMKSNFTRSRNKLLDLLDQDELPCRKDVRKARQNMDTCQAIAIDVLTVFPTFTPKTAKNKNVSWL